MIRKRLPRFTGLKLTDPKKNRLIPILILPVLPTGLISITTICQGNYWMPSADNENIYFLDCLNNYSLVKLGRSQSEPVQLASDRIEYYNVCGNMIFFQRNNLNGDAALCCMRTDGSNYKVIREGNFTNINATSQYVYFSAVGEEDTIYQTPVSGSGEVSTFLPASED